MPSRSSYAWMYAAFWSSVTQSLGQPVASCLFWAICWHSQQTNPLYADPRGNAKLHRFSSPDIPTPPLFATLVCTMFQSCIFLVRCEYKSLFVSTKVFPFAPPHTFHAGETWVCYWSSLGVPDDTDWLERGSWLWRFQSNCEYLDFQDSPRCEGDPLDRFCSCLLVDTMSWYPHTVIFLLLRVPHSIIAHHWFDPPKGYVLGWVVQSVQRSLRTGWQQECFSCPPQISVLISQWPYTLPDEHDLFSYRLLNRLLRWFDLHYSYVSYDGLLGNILNTSGKNTHETHRLSWFVHHNHPQTNVLLG